MNNQCTGWNGLHGCFVSGARVHRKVDAKRSDTEDEICGSFSSKRRNATQVGILDGFQSASSYRDVECDPHDQAVCMGRQDEL